MVECNACLNQSYSTLEDGLGSSLVVKSYVEENEMLIVLISDVVLGGLRQKWKS